MGFRDTGEGRENGSEEEVRLVCRLWFIIVGRAIELPGRKSYLLGVGPAPPTAKPIGKGVGRNPSPLPMGFAIGVGSLDPPDWRFTARKFYWVT